MQFFRSFERDAFLGDDADELLQAVLPVGQQCLGVLAMMWTGGLGWKGRGASVE